MYIQSIALTNQKASHGMMCIECSQVQMALGPLYVAAPLREPPSVLLRLGGVFWSCVCVGTCSCVCWFKHGCEGMNFSLWSVPHIGSRTQNQELNWSEKEWIAEMNTMETARVAEVFAHVFVCPCTYLFVITNTSMSTWMIMSQGP